MLRASCSIAFALALSLATTAHAQQPDPFGAGRSASGARPAAESMRSDSVPLPGHVDARIKDLDSVAYRLGPSSRLQVRTGKAGLFGFAGHSHVVQARAFHGKVVYYPKDPSSSHLEITVVADSLEVLTPRDTAEIRKVTAAMRGDILRTAEYHEITLVSRQVTPSANGFHVVGAVTLVGQTREVPIDVAVQIGLDTLEAASTFSVKQTEFGIKPFSGGPGGTVKVADRVTFEIRAVAIRSGDQAR